MVAAWTPISTSFNPECHQLQFPYATRKTFVAMACGTRVRPHAVTTTRHFATLRDRYALRLQVHDLNQIRASQVNPGARSHNSSTVRPARPPTHPPTHTPNLCKKQRYGFLSENASFAEACEKAGVTFVGPPSSAMESMGDKIESKKVAANAGVNTIPGFKVRWC